jgi:hypothetical protein
MRNARLDRYRLNAILERLAPASSDWRNLRFVIATHSPYQVSKVGRLTSRSDKKLYKDEKIDLKNSS